MSNFAILWRMCASALGCELSERKVAHWQRCPMQRSTMSVRYEFLRDTESCQRIPSQLPGQNGNYPEVTDPAGVVASLENWQIVLIMIALGIFTAFVAKSFNWIRRYVYLDKVSAVKNSRKLQQKIETEWKGGKTVSRRRNIEEIYSTK